jgi:uncharacterized membrane protein YhaH (DUF805 family)
MSLSMGIILTGLLFWLLTCAALIDIARKEFGGIEKKAAWAFLSLVPFIGVLLYFIFGFKRGKTKAQTQASPQE